MFVKFTKDKGITKLESPIVSGDQIRTFNQSNDPLFRIYLSNG